MNKPASQTLLPWLRLNLPKGSLAALTSADAAALQAAVQLVALYAVTCNRQLMQGFHVVVMEMQPSTRYMAYHAIAHVLDWSDRERLWSLAGLPSLPARFPRCDGAPRLPLACAD